MAGLPIHTASTKGLFARWSVAASRDDGTSLGDGTELSIDELDLLQGVITNPLDIPLSHCRVYYQNWTYPIERSLAPGESARLGNSQPLDLRWRLTRRSVVRAEEVRSTWQRDDLSDVDRIMEMLMFYGAAGGRAYTGLSHNYYAYVDLSRQLNSGRAILVGRGERPASRLTIQHGTSEDAPSDIESDSLQHWTYYRIVIPVRAAGQEDAN